MTSSEAPAPAPAASGVPAATAAAAASASGGHDGHVLVTGGTGKTGRRVADRLTALGRDVRIASRSAEVPFDWTDRSTWRPALDGVSAAYLAYVPDITAPDAAADLDAFARLAAECGVRRLVLLSARGLKGALPAERAVREAGPDWTVVRGSWFAQNFSEELLLGDVLAGTLTFPAGDHAEPFTDLEDLADVAVAALTGDGHAGEVYEVTGRRALTFHEVAAEISRVTGRTVTYRPVSPAAYVELLTAQGVPAELAELVAALAEESLAGPGTAPTDGVRRALGRDPHDFTDYAERTAPTGVWSP